MKHFVEITALCGLLLLSGCCLKHSWQEADCEHPRTCEKCSKTEGEALGHIWEEATCKAPKTCTHCGKTEGKPLAHKLSACEKTDTDLVAGCTRYERSCELCGKYTQSREEPLDRLWEDGIFLLIPAVQ